MKQVLLALCLVITSAVTYAQSSGPSPQLQFSSKSDEFHAAAVVRKVSPWATNVFNEAVTMISNHITTLQQQYSTNPTPALATKIQQQQAIYNDLQTLKTNIMGNASQIEGKFQSFLAIM